MIKINLARRKQVLTSASKGSSLLSKMGDFSSQFEIIKNIPIQKILLPVIVGVAAHYTVQYFKNAAIDQAEAELTKVKEERPRLLAEANKMKGYEEQKKILESEEAMIRTKINTIRQLIAGRNTPPQLLIALANSIPQEVWLSEFKIQNLQITMKGHSIGFNQISDFMKNLNENAYFSDLALKNTQQAKDNNGHEIATFELSAKQRSGEI